MNELLDIAFRTSAAYLLLLLLTRVLGRKQISQLTFFDFVSGITFGSIAASTFINPEMSLAVGFVALVVWAGWVQATARLTLSSLPARKLIEAEPLTVIRKGAILEKNLAANNYNVNDLLKQLREKGVFDPGEVELAIIESDGQVSILKDASAQPLTPATVGMKTAPAARNMEGQDLIIDGQLLEDNLPAVNLTRKQLLEKLSAHGVRDIGDVVLASYTPKGEIYLDLREDRIRGETPPGGQEAQKN